MEILAKHQYKQGIRWLIGSGAIATLSVLSIFSYSWLSQRTVPPVAVTTISIQRDSIENPINASGTVKLGGQQTLKAPSESTIEQVLVGVGQSVRAGEKAIVLRDSERETSLQQKQTEIEEITIALERNRQQVQEAEQTLETARQTAEIQDLTFAEERLNLERDRQKVDEAQADLQDSEEELVNLQALADKGYISGDRLRQQRKAVRDAEIIVRDRQLTVETKTLSLQRNILEQSNQLRTEIATAQSQLQDAQLEKERLELQLERQQLELQTIELKLQETLITAPIDGIILALQVKNGDGVALGSDLLTLGDPTQERVSLSLSTLDAAKVRIGQPARITIIGPNSPTYDGQVISLSPQASSPEEEQQGGQASVSATVALNEPTGTLIPGSQVNVEIILAQQTDVIVVSLAALQRSQGMTFVWIKDARGLAQKREVVLGLEGLASVEIVSGLEVGDEVILPDVDLELQPGMAVTSAKRE